VYWACSSHLYLTYCFPARGIDVLKGNNASTINAWLKELIKQVDDSVELDADDEKSASKADAA
jgi:hypothetical protein